jgi:DNA-binding response OmpR family regulator
MSQELLPIRVFVVDDEPIISTTMAMILRQEGFESHAFELPMEALRTSREIAPDLLVTDVNMPLLSGIELAIQVREYCPKCAVLLFSGVASTSDLLEKARSRGHNFEVLAKPVHPLELLDKIHSMMKVGLE